MLDLPAAEAAVRTLLKLRAPEQERLCRIADYVRGDHNSVYVPGGASREYRWIVDRSKVNLMRLVIGVVAQNLYVDGYRHSGDEDNAPAWAIWQANRMDARQHGIHRAGLKYGLAYTLVLPGDPAPVITPMSPRRLTAFYADPTNDEWPMFAVEVTSERTVQDGKPGKRDLVRLFDEDAAYSFVRSGESELVYLSTMEHGLGVCPVVRYLNETDLDEDDAVTGEIEPLIELQDQVNFTTFGLLMAQLFAAFRQRYVSGMVAEDEQGRPVAPFRAWVDSLLVAEDPDTKFGEFAATDLTGYLKSREESIREIATIAQVPPYHLLGQISNLSAEALAAARDGLDSKVGERKSTFGESHEQTLRLAALASGDKDGWQDTAAQVVWRDTSARAFAAIVDGLGKLAQMLGVPQQALWERVPGVTQTDVARWREMATEATDPFTQLDQTLQKQADAPVDQYPGFPDVPPVLIPQLGSLVKSGIVSEAWAAQQVGAPTAGLETTPVADG